MLSHLLRFFGNKGVKQAQPGVPHSRRQLELGFILQAGTCQILSLTENPRWSRVWQKQILSLEVLDKMLHQGFYSKMLHSFLGPGIYFFKIVIQPRCIVNAIVLCVQ